MLLLLLRPYQGSTQWAICCHQAISAMLSNLVGVDGMNKKNIQQSTGIIARLWAIDVRIVPWNVWCNPISHVPSECGILFSNTIKISSNVWVLLCFGKVSFETNATTLDCDHISCRICQQPAQTTPYTSTKKNIFLLWTSIKLHSKLTHESHEEQNPCSTPFPHPTQNRPPVYIPSCSSATVFPGVWPTTINLTPSSFRRLKTCDENSPTLNAMSHRGILRINKYTLNLLNLS